MDKSGYNPISVTKGVVMLLSRKDMTEIQGWLRQAGKIALQSQSSLTMTFKTDHTPVTDAEFRIENMIIEKIRQKFPAHQILTEEQGLVGGDNDYLWALDPVDGTKSFLRGLPTWGISLGLLYRAKPVAGFFYIPAVKEMFWGSELGAFMNNRPLPRHVVYEESLTFLAVSANAHLRFEIDFPRLQAFGSTAVHCSYLARGIAAGVLTRRINLWDIAGFLPIFEQLDISCQYLSGAPIDTTALLNGQKTPEPVLAAHSDMLTDLRKGIHPRK